MSFSGRTPESLIPRSDSKNPATTCKGITANGRPCRRALAGSSRSSPVPSPSRNEHGVLAVLDRNDAAAFYCWQHKDQAESLAARPEQKTTLFPLKERSSLDSIVEKVGVVDLDSEVGSDRRRRRKKHTGRSKEHEPHLTKRDTLPSGWHDMQGPLMTVPEEYVRPKPKKRDDYIQGRSNVKASWSCCIRADDSDDDGPRPRQPQRWPDANGYASPASMQAAPRPSAVVQRKPVPPPQQPQNAITVPVRTPQSRPNPSPSPSSQTQALMSLIPSTASPQTASLLLAELSKPLSPTDESGYIYIFWLTPDSLTSKPDDETASSLLTDSEPDSDSEDDSPHHQTPTRPRNHAHRRPPNPHRRQQSDALRRYASVRHPTSSTPSSTPHKPPNKQNEPTRTILLKIGRASNVHRRMTQWTKQCGQDITLVRFYPYHHRQKQANSTSNLPSPPTNTAGTTGAPLKCPHITRVERLIHLELAEQRVLNTGKKCGECGREHREWFEVEASKGGLRGVDDVVRRWVGWAMGLRLEDGEQARNNQQQVKEPVGRAVLREVDGYY